MQCPRCHGENPERARFCEDCGARLELRCPHCGEGATPGKKFCASCGGSLVAAPATSGPTPSLQDYLPRHLAERIISSRGALEGERKQVTVLFADLKGSMELLADRDPEEARAILDPALAHMMEAVHRYEGTVNQVLGDGIMALFGAPLAHEDHAVRACYAALALQEAIRGYGEQVRRTHGVPVQARVGLNSGEVVVRAISSDLHMDYSAIGETTHLAARMEQLATPGATYLTPATLQLVEGLVQVRSLGPTPVKGLVEPVEVLELLGAAPARSRLQAAATRGLSKFVGRDAELDTLRRTLELAGRGQGQVVAVVGEPGVGKSRLVWEFSHSHRAQGWLVLESRSVSYGKATSYLPIVDLLRSYCGIEARDEPRRVREKLTGKVLALDPALGPALPPLLALLDVPVEDTAWQALDPPQRRALTLDGLKRLLLRESQVQPLLLVFEDLHWIDSETQALLDSLVESLPAARLLLLVNYRPEYQHGWASKTYYSQLRLDPLAAENAEELLDALLGNEAGLAALKRLLIERTEGNPFFLEESVRTLLETGVLAGERGSYRLARPVEATRVPATVQAVLAARIDRLAPEDKRLLQAAAVIGKDTPYPLLRAVADLPEDALRHSLACLQAAEFLYETRLFPEREHTFKHALTHEVAYGTLLQERRCALHARLVEAIELLYPDRLAEHVERLAYHALRGEAWRKAVDYARQAGGKAVARSAYREAVFYFEQAFQALGRLPEDQDTREQAVDLHLDMRSALTGLGDHQLQLHHLRQAERLAAGLDDQRRLARIPGILAGNLWQLGQLDQAIASAQSALAIAETSGDLPQRVTAAFNLGRAYYSRGEFGRAVKYFGDDVAALTGEHVKERFGLPFLPGVNARAWVARCLAERGEFAAGAASGAEALQMAESADHPFSLVIVCLNVGHLHLLQGNLLAATDLLKRGVALCESRHIPVLWPQVATYLGYAYALCGRLAEALPLLEESEERIAAMGMVLHQALAAGHLGKAYLLAGRWDEALRATQRALGPAREQQAHGQEAWALCLLGDIAAHSDPLDSEQAQIHYRQALALAQDLGMRPLVAHCHLGLGTLYQRIDCDAPAQAELSTAAEMYRAMEMPYWLEKAEAALAQVPH